MHTMINHQQAAGNITFFSQMKTALGVFVKGVQNKPKSTAVNI